MRRLTAFLIFLFAAAHAASSALAAPTLPPQTTSASGVTVKATPQSLSDKSWDFEIAFDTHSQAPNDDLMKAAELIADGGARFQPISWQGDPPGGHHRKGVLRFKPISPAPQSIELRIMRSDEVQPRSFRWQLK